MENKDRGLTAIVLLGGIDSLAELDAWAAEFGATHLLLSDQDDVAWDAYITMPGRPQYFAIDRDMTIVDWGRSEAGSQQVKNSVLALLDAE